jgi:tetratricopeptide (TPR) repeat protein
LVRGALALLLSGKGALADRLVAAAGDLERARLPLEPATRAQRHVFHALRALYRSDLSTYLKEELLAQRCFEEAGDERRALNESGSVGYAYLELGAWDAAEQALARTLAGAERAELAHVSAAAYHNLGMVYARQGRFAEARAAENRALEVFRTQRDRRLEGAALAYLGHIHLLAGDLERAASTAESALGLVSEVAPPIMPLPLAISAAVELARGRVDLACDISNRAMQLIESGKDVEAGETLARLVHAESLLRAGRTAEARAALSSARARLLQRADRIEDPALRSSFLREVPENARTLQLSES